MMMRVVLAGLAAVSLFSGMARAEIPIREITSPGGIKAWLVEETSIPFTALEIRFRGGASLDEPGKRGAINLMTALLEEGAGPYDAQGYSAAREALATNISFRASDDTIAVSARFLTENRDAAAELVRVALTEPRFEQEAVERVRAQVLAGIRQDAKDPDAIAAATFNRLAFGDDPYGSVEDGTEESVPALTRDDLIRARDRVLARDRVYVSAVGDIGEAELGDLIDRLLGGLPATGAPLPPDVTFAAPGGIKVVEFDTPQSVIAFGQPGISRDDPDFFPAYVLNEVLGGGRFTARLMREVREKRGLTYGVYTGLAGLDRTDFITGRLATANARVGEAVQVIRDEWAKAARDGVTEEELEAARTYLTGSYPLRFDGNATIARILVGMQMDGYDTGYIARRNALVEAVTMEDVKRVAHRLLDPEKLQFVIVGKPQGL